MMMDTVLEVPYDSTCDKRFSPIYKHQINQCTLLIPGGGCVYYRACKGDVCPFCAFPAFTRHVIKGPGYEDDYKPWTLKNETYKEMYRRSIHNICEAEKLAIFNGGSFFPNSELPSDFQRYVYEDVASRSHITQLMVESYPSYITEKKLRLAKEMLGTTDFMVGIGFESVDDYVRNELLKKRIERSLFENKIRLMKNLDVQVFVYAFLKAPQLSESQALNETLNTIRYLNDLGVDEIAISCAFVPSGTDIETLYNAGEFRPPWLWTILEIIEAAAKNRWPVSIGGFEDTPPPIAGPHNCPVCDSKINNQIDNYRQYGEMSSNSINCECFKEWEKEF